MNAFDLIRSMRAKGADADSILDAVIELEEAKAIRRRKADAERQRRHRMSRTVTRDNRDIEATKEHPRARVEGSFSTKENPGINNPGKYAFEHGCVRLTQCDLDKWVAAFPAVSVRSELLAAEPWLATERSWFQAAAGLLAKRQREAPTIRAKSDRPAGRDPWGHPLRGAANG